METNGSISAEEASAALESVRHSRARVAWGGYPVWYWLLTGACLSAGCAAILLPDGWDVASVAVLVALAAGVARAASRARGVCEGWTRSAMTWRDGLALFAPSTVLILGAAFAWRFTSWAPWSSIVAAVAVFVLFAGTGLTLSARATRR
jgi:uncharacterized membrane protein YjjP (DUF1212 family)